MKKALLLASLILLASGCKRGPTLEGDWKASTTAGPLTVHLDMNVKPESGGKYSGTLDVPELKLTAAKLDTITLSDGSVDIAAGQGGSFKGKLSDDGNSIDGDWTIAGTAVKLNFKKTTDAK